METLEKPADGSLFMRPLALGWTAYLFGSQLLFLVTRGAFHSPDSWAEIYTLILATYAGAPEVQRWAAKTGRSEEPHDWSERIRKGGPLIIAWNILLAGAGALRMWDPTWPMPLELKSITMQITTLFFGTYALRQVRRRAVAKDNAEFSGSDDANALEEASVVDYLRQKGPRTPTDIAKDLAINRRSLGRLLSRLVANQTLIREARYPSDPNATYKISQTK